MVSCRNTSNNNNPLVLPSSSSSGGVGEGIERGPVEIILASWGDRFLAWLVDFILVSIGYGSMERVLRDTGPLPYIISSLGFLAYWAHFESTTSGQSIGKRLLKIR
jgi:RDD family